MRSPDEIEPGGLTVPRAHARGRSRGPAEAGPGAPYFLGGGRTPASLVGGTTFFIRMYVTRFP